MKREAIVDLKRLEEYLDIVNNIFPINDLIENKLDIKEIKSYFKGTHRSYKYLHSKQGSVHMALNYDGIFDEKGFYGQANEISEIIDSSDVKNVLELGCGKGFNSIHLAKKHPHINFLGIDITDEHIAIAKENSKDIKNIAIDYGNFNALDFKESSFDLIFAVEAFCYVSNLEKTLTDIYRILKPNGQFIVYDGFKTEVFDQVSESLQKVAIITEKSMALNAPKKVNEWLNIAQEVGFHINVKKDISEAVMPNMARIQRLARSYYKFPFLSKLLLKLLPKDVLLSSIAGLFMPFTVHHHVHRYYKIVIKKKE